MRFSNRIKYGSQDIRTLAASYSGMCRKRASPNMDSMPLNSMSIPGAAPCFAISNHKSRGTLHSQCVVNTRGSLMLLTVS